MSNLKIFEEIAKPYGLDPRLVIAIAKVESSLEPSVVRFEPAWAYHWRVTEFAKSLNISRNTEKTLQAMSWGLMQVMGTVARELGYKDMLTKLIKPRTNIRLGCLQLVKLFDRYDDKIKVIAAYNAGSARKGSDGKFVNQEYVDKVLRNLARS